MNGNNTVHIYAPGRTELAGNHVDHQRGMIMAAAIDEGIDFWATPNGSTVVQVKSEGFEDVSVDLADLTPKEEERQTSAAYVRGVLAALQEEGVELTGFDAQVKSSLIPGGGLSSSAAFSVGFALCAATIAGAQVPKERLACAAKKAEVDYFGKPCGLMDQMAVACGGVIAVDFSQTELDPDLPHVTPIEFPWEGVDLDIVLVDTGASHADNGQLFARIVQDMKDVAHLCGGQVLGDISEMEMMQHFKQIRETLGDKALLRAWHYYREMLLVDARIQALQSKDIDAFIKATRQSGNSSAQYLQNISEGGASQPAMIALALAEHLIGDQGACRIHGGGFGGTIQAFMPHLAVPGFVRSMELFLAPGCCTYVRIDPQGVRVVEDE